MLNALGMGEVTALRREFKEDTVDVDWIPVIGRNGWTLIGCDRGQIKDPKEKMALKDAGVIAFYLAKGFDSFQLVDKAWRLVKVWPSIIAASESTRGGQCYMVRTNGAIEVLALR